ncbi:MAG: ATP-binding cassette domain-containing protein [Alphaproteobacteria bacterium]|nr:ATP-binding cassette domain-containing protein [Alphaproteobacteria bacterium]
MDIALLLLQDGMTTGAAYALLALSLVLVFVVSRVILIQAGEYVSYAALSLTVIQSGNVPFLVWIMAGVSAIIGVHDIIRAQAGVAMLKAALFWIAIPGAILVATLLLVPLDPPAFVKVLLALAIVVPMGPAWYRLAYRRIARSSTLVLLIVSMAVQFVMGGVGLAVFGPEGSRTEPFSSGFLEIGSFSIPAQSLWIFGVTAAIIVALVLFFRFTMRGTALRAAAHNPNGALLMGISPESAGQLSFGLAAFLCAVTGVLISPILTIYYDTGFIIGLKAFIGAVVGGFVSYPLAAVGALGIGIFESFAAFASSAYKEVIVFALVVPVLFLRSTLSHKGVDLEEGFAGEVKTSAGASSPLVRRIRAMLWSPWGIAVIALVLLCLPYGMNQTQQISVNYILLFTMVVIGVCLLTGIAGQVSFGQAAFVGVGAYTAAIIAGPCANWDNFVSIIGLDFLVGSCGLPAWSSLLVSLILTTIIAVFLGAITLRMRSHFLPIATISWAICIYYFFGSSDLLGGFSGLTDLQPLNLNFPSNLPYEGQLYYPMLVVTILFFAVTANLLNSRTGRGIRALHSRTVLAESVGIATINLKVKVFVIAALMACVSGWFYMQLQRFVSPESFSLLAGAKYLFMAVVGGEHHLAGALLGSSLVEVLNKSFQAFFTWTSLGRFGDFEQILFGAVIVLVFQFTRGGIAQFFVGLLPSQKLARASGKPLDHSHQESVPKGTVLLDICNISKSFGGLKALNNVSFQVKAGEVVALIGPNGAGKSTLFNAVSGISQANTGDVLIRETAVSSLSPHDISALGVMRTFQHVKLLSDRSVLENVAIGAYRRGKSGILKSLLRLDRAEEQRTLDMAYHCLVRIGLQDTADTPAAELPLGQQRLVEVARALAAEPALLLLDEPAAGLRYQEKQALAEVLRQLRDEGMGILVVEHDMAFVMGLADRVVVMNFGEKIAEGTTSEVQSNPLVREAYLGA